MVRQTFGMDAEVELGPVLQLPQPALVQQDLSYARPKDKSLSQRASLSDQHHQDDSGHRDVDRSASSRPLEPLDGPMDIEVLPGLIDPPINKYRFAAVCTQTLLAGLTDSAPGALIPYLETYYNIGYAVVSLIFISNAVGFIIAAPVIAALQARLGRSRTLALGDLLIVAGFIPLVVAAPFPAIVAGYLVIGFGFALNLSISNVFTANMRNGTTLLGLMHGSYGLGGIVGPLVATSIVSTAGSEAWHRFYYITVALALFNGCFFYWSFRDYEGESISNGDHTQPQPQGTATAMASTPPGAKEHVTNMLQALGSRIVLLGAIFIFAYQGAEVSISGWVISFLITFRGGDPHSVGNVTSGFWGGITLGRLILSPLGARVGEKRFVYFITVGAAVFQLLIWFVPNIISNAVSLAIAGLLLGPVYPCAATVLARSLTRREQDSGLAVVWAFESSGGAVAPFLTGLLAQAVGTFVLHPIVLALYAVMVLCWFLLPALRKRTE